MWTADSVDTRSVLEAMRDLVSLCNIYIDTRRKAGSRPNSLLLKNIATYITRILRVNFLFHPLLCTLTCTSVLHCFGVGYVTGRFTGLWYIPNVDYVKNKLVKNNWSSNPSQALKARRSSVKMRLKCIKLLTNPFTHIFNGEESVYKWCALWMLN